MSVISLEEFASVVESCGVPEELFPCGVGVSGGADSLCLAFLLHRYRGKEVRGLCVDHGLRTSSLEEARKTQSRLASFGMESEVYGLKETAHWPPPKSSVQEWARCARYEVMMKACHHFGLKSLWIGHHLGDQAETFLIRLAHASGTRGLGGMKMCTLRGRFPIVRPLLKYMPYRLKETLLQEGLSWVEDPSNSDKQYERVRLREALESLVPVQERLFIRLGTVARRLEEDHQVLLQKGEAFLKRHGCFDSLWVFSCALAPFKRLPPALRWRVLQLMCASGEIAPFERLAKGLLRYEKRSGSVGSFGAYLFVVEKEQLIVLREGRNLREVEVVCLRGVGCTVVFDKRYEWRLIAPVAFSGKIVPFSSLLSSHGSWCSHQREEIVSRFFSSQPIGNRLLQRLLAPLPVLVNDKRHPVVMPHSRYCCLSGYGQSVVVRAPFSAPWEIFSKGGKKLEFKG